MFFWLLPQSIKPGSELVELSLVKQIELQRSTMVFYLAIQNVGKNSRDLNRAVKSLICHQMSQNNNMFARKHFITKFIRNLRLVKMTEFKMTE